ncbi:hypothetical protein DPMN_034442 [Dreissena polymorpha]|uniref:Uncharacterized protein n=1 Tax=Dreissena polymorpha TaxID=45954 RepID=A0A9D4M7K6_DREPO|nr:hypothetical protein DPMN_034442 [Dreissena polymorpha]
MAQQRPTRMFDPGGAPGVGPCIVEIDRIVIRYVQYQFEVSLCRNEEVIGVPGLVMGPCIIEIDRIVIRDVQYQFEVNRCRNEEIIVKGNFEWAWSMWAGCPRTDRIVIRDVQYQFEVNGCRNEEVNFQGSSAYSVGGDSGQDGQTDGGDNHNVPTLFKKQG